jgi:hypothetical protein
MRFVHKMSTMAHMPALVTKPTPMAVVDEHLDALNRGDWSRLMAQYPDDVAIFLPAGVVIRGRAEVGDAFRAMTAPFEDGGLLGVTFTPEHVFTVSTFDMDTLRRHHAR